MGDLNKARFLERVDALGLGLRERIQAEVAGFSLDEPSRKRRVKRAQADFRYFCCVYFPHYIPTKKFGKFQQFVFERFPGWARTEGLRELVGAPRGSAKSTIITQIGVIYCLVFELHWMIMLIMDTEVQAAEMLEAIKAELDSNPRLAGDYPDACGIGKIWNADEIITRSGRKVKAASTMKRIRGTKHGPFRPSLVILDDLENDVNVTSKTQRDKLLRWRDNNVLNLGPPDGSLSVIHVGTNLHYDSLFSRTAKTPGWNSTVFRSIISWPNRMDLWEAWEAVYKIDQSAAKRFWQERSADMSDGSEVDWPGIRPLYSLMMLRAASHESFDQEQQNDPGRSNERVNSITFYDESDVPPDAIRLGALDPSLGKSINSDPSALIVGAYHRPSGILYVLHASIARRPPATQTAEIISLQRKIHCANWVVETTQFQSFYADTLRTDSLRAGVPVPVVPHLPRDPKDSRILSIFPFVNSGHIRFRRDQTTLIEQIKFWPEVDSDDGPDALSMLFTHAAQLTAVPEFEAVHDDDHGEFHTHSRLDD